MTLHDDHIGAPAEQRRQRAVDSLHDALHGDNDRLDRITRLARSVFGVAATSVTVLDHDRAWFPSESGLGIAEMPRSQTLCDTAQAGDETLVVEDARADPRFRHLAPVADGSLVFYAGRPLHDHLGNVVGTFCLFDGAARTLDAEQRRTFDDLAAWAEQELVASSEMGQARQVQTSLFPSQPLESGPWSVDGMCLPALAVGGDCYDFGLGGGVLHVGVGDVMGKGTSAALLGAGARAAIRATHGAVTAGADLGVIATQVARSLTPDLERSESFLTVFEAAVDLEDGWTRWVDAGSGLAAQISADGTTTYLTGDDRPFGVLPDDHWTEHTTTLEPGDRLVIISDGVLDLVEDQALVWEDLAVATRAAATPADLLAEVRRWAEVRPPLDDVTVLAVFRAAAPTADAPRPGAEGSA